MSGLVEPLGPRPADRWTGRVVKALAWRSGGQIFAQLVTWSATFLVIRILQPGDYGTFAMTQSVLALLGMLSGASFASALVRQPSVTRTEIRQVFGLLLLLNLGLAALQIAAAPLIADYYGHPRLVALLRVQALLYVANPFIALSTALLAREMDFRKQALAHLASAVAGAGTALLGALCGLGVWTLVAAPIAMFWTRAIGVTLAARPDLRPIFDFRGAGVTVRFGVAMLTSQVFWFVQTQSDVLIGGRVLSPEALGFYTTGLFLAQILTSKFIPPLNEVAYSAYARLQGDRAAVANAFARSVRMIMLVAMPFYCGMAVTAGPLVATVLGSQWAGAVAPIRWIACAMPFVTLQILFSPVTNALGRPRLAVYGAVAGAAIMPLVFALCVRQGAQGLALAWVIGFPILALFTAAISLPTIGLAPRRLAAAVLPALAAGLGMAMVVLLVDHALPIAYPPARLGILIAAGLLSYGALALLVARDSLVDLLGLLRTRAPPVRG